MGSVAPAPTPPPPRAATTSNVPPVPYCRSRCMSLSWVQLKGGTPIFLRDAPRCSPPSRDCAKCRGVSFEEKGSHISAVKFAAETAVPHFTKRLRRSGSCRRLRNRWRVALYALPVARWAISLKICTRARHGGDGFHQSRDGYTRRGVVKSSRQSTGRSISSPGSLPTVLAEELALDVEQHRVGWRRRWIGRRRAV